MIVGWASLLILNKPAQHKKVLGGVIYGALLE